MGKVVSLKKARRILGARAKKMSDGQVLEYLDALHLIAKENTMYNGSKDKENGENGNPTPTKDRAEDS
jgi:hypothetical protein